MVAAMPVLIAALALRSWQVYESLNSHQVLEDVQGCAGCGGQMVVAQQGPYRAYSAFSAMMHDFSRCCIQFLSSQRILCSMAFAQFLSSFHHITVFYLDANNSVCYDLCNKVHHKMRGLTYEETGEAYSCTHETRIIAGCRGRSYGCVKELI